MEDISAKKILLTSAIVVLVIFGVFGAYNLGRKSAKNSTQNVMSAESEADNISFTDNQIALSPTPTINLSVTPASVKTIVLTGDAALDGFRQSNDTGNDAQDIRVGRTKDFVIRGFISFDTRSIPNGVTLTEATLKLNQAKIVGSPFTTGGQLKIDHLTYGDSLDTIDFGLPALTSSFATLSTSTKLELKEVNVLEYLRDDMANARPRSQYRIHFQKEVAGGTSNGDYVMFESGDNSLGSGTPPQLVVKYF